MLALSFGCKRRVHVSGKVIDSKTGEPVEGATVFIRETNEMSLTGEQFLGNHYSPVKSRGDGTFIIEFKDHKRIKNGYIAVLQSDMLPSDTVSAFNKVFQGDPPVQQSAPMGKRGGAGIMFTVTPVARFILIMERKGPKKLDSWVLRTVENGVRHVEGGLKGDPLPVITRCLQCPKGFIVFESESVVDGISTFKIDTVPAKPFELIRHRLSY